jgi:hypothetical protein
LRFQEGFTHGSFDGHVFWAFLVQDIQGPFTDEGQIFWCIAFVNTSIIFIKKQHLKTNAAYFRCPNVGGQRRQWSLGWQASWKEKNVFPSPATDPFLHAWTQSWQCFSGGASDDDLEANQDHPWHGKGVGGAPIL